MEVMFAHCYDAIPDPRVLAPQIPEACLAVVHRALAKEPNDRFASANEMLAHLEAIRGDAVVCRAAHPPALRRRAHGDSWNALCHRRAGGADFDGPSWSC